MSEKRVTGHLKITTPEDFNGARLLPRNLNIELDGQPFEATFDIRIEMEAKGVVRATLGFYPASLEIDAPAIMLFSELSAAKSSYRARADITPREWDAMEWAEIGRNEEGEPLYAPAGVRQN
jgi:hypothetical protein